MGGRGGVGSLVFGNPALGAGMAPGALGQVCLVGSCRAPSPTWWAFWPLEVASGGECPGAWALDWVQVGSPSGSCLRGGAGEIVCWGWGLTYFTGGGSLRLSFVVAPTHFSHPYQHPGSSLVGGSLDLSEVHEVACWAGRGLLALQAAEGI